MEETVGGGARYARTVPYVHDRRKHCSAHADTHHHIICMKRGVLAPLHHCGLWRLEGTDPYALSDWVVSHVRGEAVSITR